MNNNLSLALHISICETLAPIPLQSLFVKLWRPFLFKIPMVTADYACSAHAAVRVEGGAVVCAG